MSRCSNYVIDLWEAMVSVILTIKKSITLAPTPASTRLDSQAISPRSSRDAPMARLDNH